MPSPGEGCCSSAPRTKGCPGFCRGRKFLTRKDKESIFTMDHFPLWYRRAAEHPPGSFIYSIVSEDDSGNPSLNTRAEKTVHILCSLTCQSLYCHLLLKCWDLASWHCLCTGVMAKIWELDTVERQSYKLWRRQSGLCNIRS